MDEGEHDEELEDNGEELEGNGEQEEEEDLRTTSSMILPDFFENILRKIQILQMS